MTPSPYTEDTLVQQTTADCLERLGWESVYAHNREDFGPAGLLGRASDRDVVLTRPLRAALAALNRTCRTRRTTRPCCGSRRPTSRKPWSPPTASGTA